MDRVLELDQKNLTIHVESGVVTQKVAELADAAVVCCPTPVGHLNMDITGTHHRCRLFTPPTLMIQSTLDSLLAVTQDFWVNSIHSKCFFTWLG